MPMKVATVKLDDEHQRLLEKLLKQRAKRGASPASRLGVSEILRLGIRLAAAQEGIK